MKLALFFTDGVSLATWRAGGMLAREMALYHALIEWGVAVEFVSYGRGHAHDFQDALGAIALRNNRLSLPEALYKHSLRWSPPRADLIKSNQVAGAELALQAARRRGVPFVARCGYLLSDFEARRHGPDSAPTRQARALEARVFGQADAVVVTTAAMRDVVLANYEVPHERVRVIPNYVETGRFQPASPPSNPRPRIGFVGRLDTQKNLPVLLEALLPLDIDLVLVGDGRQHDVLYQQAQSGQATVHFMGQRPSEDLPDIMAQWDAFVLPSLYEGHPKALIEAMACGLPVVGTRVAGIREIIEDGVNGLLAEPDAASLRSAVQRLIDDGDLRQRLGLAARDYAVQHFSLERVVALELDMLRAVTNA